MNLTVVWELHGEIFVVGIRMWPRVVDDEIFLTGYKFYSLCHSLVLEVVFHDIWLMRARRLTVWIDLRHDLFLFSLHPSRYSLSVPMMAI
jgi:hypothetical protein